MSPNTLTTPRPAEAWHQSGHIHLRLADGKELTFPVAGNPRLERGTPEQLNHIEWSPFGLHWPDLDEDLSMDGLLRKDWGQFAARMPQG